VRTMRSNIGHDPQGDEQLALATVYIRVHDDVGVLGGLGDLSSRNALCIIGGRSDGY
jgi:hypothetical protein